MRTIIVNPEVELNLADGEISYEPTNILARNYTLIGIGALAKFYKGQLTTGTVNSVTLSNVVLDEETHIGVYVLSNKSIQRVQDNLVRFRTNANNTIVEFLYDAVQDCVVVVQEEQYEAVDCTLVNQTGHFTHQLFIESPVQVNGSCVAGNKVFNIVNGVNVLNCFGNLKLRLNLESPAPVAILPVYSDSNVVYKNINQPAGRLLQCSCNFTQVKGNQSQQVLRSNPQLDTRVFFTFDAHTSPNNPPLVLKFGFSKPFQYMIQYREQTDVQIELSLHPVGYGIMPVVSSQLVKLRG